MKRIFFLLLCSAITVNVVAQTVEFIEPRNVQSVPEADFLTYKVGDNFYVLQKKFRMGAPLGLDLQLDAYDANRKPIGSNMIDRLFLEPGDGANLYNGIFPLKDRLVMFKSEYSKSSGTKMMYLYYYPFDLYGKRQKKMSLSTIVSESAFNSGNFHVAASPDGSKVAVISELPFDKDGMEKCTVTVYDDKFKQLWKKEYTFAYESSRAPQNTLFVNDNGIVFILKQINLKKAFDQFSVFTFLNEGNNVVEKKIDLGNGFTIATFKNLFKENGDLQLAGYFYMDKKVGINVKTPDGVFYVDANATTGELNAAQSHGGRVGTKTALQLFSLPDNSVCLVGESEIVNSKPAPGKPLESVYDYQSGTVYATKINADGTLGWEYKFDRELRSVSDGGKFLSVYGWANGSDVNLLFGDILSRHDDRKQFIEIGSTRIYLIQAIGADGKRKGETVIADPRIGGKRGDYYFIPATGSAYKDHKIFMLAARGMELVGATVSY